MSVFLGLGVRFVEFDSVGWPTHLIGRKTSKTTFAQLKHVFLLQQGISRGWDCPAPSASPRFSGYSFAVPMPLGHGRHIVAVSIITIIRVLSTHHVSLLGALVSQQIFVPYPWASRISNKMVSQSWENDNARTNQKRSAANGRHKGIMRVCSTVPCWHSYHFFRTCQVRPGLSLSLGAPPLFASDSRRSPRPCGHTRARDLSQARRQFLGSHGTAETCVSRVPDQGGHARVRAHAR